MGVLYWSKNRDTEMMAELTTVTDYHLKNLLDNYIELGYDKEDFCEVALSYMLESCLVMMFSNNKEDFDTYLNLLRYEVNKDLENPNRVIATQARWLMGTTTPDEKLH